MSSNVKTKSDINVQYEEVKKLMKELDDLSDNFDSVILAQDKFSKNNLVLQSSDQNNITIDNSKSLSDVLTNNSGWGFIQDKDLYREKEKLLKHVVI